MNKFSFLSLSQHDVRKNFIASVERFPFAVSFGYRADDDSFSHFCGGCIIANDFKSFSWAISAAHCFAL